MQDQKTRTTDSTTDETLDTDLTTQHGQSTNEVPSWGELADEINLKGSTGRTVVFGAVAVAMTFFLPVGIFASVLAVSFATSLLNQSNGAIGALAGVGAVLFASAFLSGVGGLIGTVLLFPVLPELIAGLLLGASGSYIGGKIRQKLS